MFSKDRGIIFSLFSIPNHLKQLTVCLSDRNSNSAKAAGKKYCKERLENSRRLENIFIDECGFKEQEGEML